MTSLLITCIYLLHLYTNSLKFVVNWNSITQGMPGMNKHKYVKLCLFSPNSNIDNSMACYVPTFMLNTINTT